MKIPARYTNVPGNPSLVYDSICKTLSNRSALWSQFGSQEWLLLPHIAQAEGVGPLLYWKLKGMDCVIPGVVLSHLAAEYYATAARNTLLFRELDRILAALAEANIPVILLKGAALAQTL